MRAVLAQLPPEEERGLTQCLNPRGMNAVLAQCIACCDGGCAGRARELAPALIRRGGARTQTKDSMMDAC